MVNLPERFLIRVPEGADPKLAVALVLDWVTAYQMLHHAAHVKSGQRIFVHGLSGAVGQALLALGKIQEAQVFGTASPGKHEPLRQLGAVPFDYSNKNWISAMKELGGVDARIVKIFELPDNREMRWVASPNVTGRYRNSNSCRMGSCNVAVRRWVIR